MNFISGAIMMGNLVASLLFLRFWRTTRDRLFLIFSLGFLLMGVEKIILEVTRLPSEQRPLIYLIRALAFSMIAWGIIDKNLGGRSRERRG